MRPRPGPMHALLTALFVALDAAGAYAAYAGPYILATETYLPCESQYSDGSMTLFASFTPLNKKNPNELQRMTAKATVLSDHGPNDTFWKWTYDVQDEPVNWTLPKVPILPYGTWRYTITLGTGTDTHLCNKATIHTIPKNPPRA
ncbi:Nuclear pore membrane glycoprotein 210-like [Frankliniella fusca]|uniref:Nuclear pore membrane glycoprotein 210-like n=1 Tax=Frankliniella fusca TaxID=407009 RepID=A0AAE1LRH9_9NEOP|nr:Nuclear pore membrane glycoprotein 210-like [Frankliniella fusca]